MKGAPRLSNWLMWGQSQRPSVPRGRASFTQCLVFQAFAKARRGTEGGDPAPSGFRDIAVGMHTSKMTQKQDARRSMPRRHWAPRLAAFEGLAGAWLSRWGFWGDFKKERLRRGYGSSFDPPEVTGNACEDRWARESRRT